MWQTFWAIFYKELLEVRSRTLLLRAIVVLQILEVGMVGWLDLSVKNMPLVVVDEDHTAASRELVERIVATHTFAMKYVTSSKEQARSHIRAGQAKIAIVIPSDYGRRRAAGQSTEVLALVDGSDSTASTQATATLDGLAVEMNVTSSQENVPLVEPRANLLFNPDGSTSSFMLPGLLALLLSNNYSTYTLALAREREEGNLERLLMTPMNYTGLILGQLMPYVVISTLNGVVYMVAVHFIFDVPFRGSIALLLLALWLYNLTFLSLSSFLAASAKTENEAFTSLLYLTFPALFLSGYIFPLSSLPKWLLPVSYLMPETHFIEIMRGFCLRGSSALDLAPYFVFLTVAPILLLVGAGRRFARSIMD